MRADMEDFMNEIRRDAIMNYDLVQERIRDKFRDEQHVIIAVAIATVLPYLSLGDPGTLERVQEILREKKRI